MCAYHVQALDESCAEQNCSMAIGFEVDADIELLRCGMEVLDAGRGQPDLAVQVLANVLGGRAVCIGGLHNAHLQQGTQMGNSPACRSMHAGEAACRGGAEAALTAGAASCRGKPLRRSMMRVAASTEILSPSKSSTSGPPPRRLKYISLSASPSNAAHLQRVQHA
jgi:hypothetical protein